MSLEEATLKVDLEKFGQEHLIDHFNLLNEEEKTAFANDLAAFDLMEMREIFTEATRKGKLTIAII